MKRVALFLREMKQRRRVRRGIAFVFFPVAYILSFIHPYYGFSLLVKLYLTDLSLFDRIAAQRLRRMLSRSLPYYYSTQPEFQKDPEAPNNVEAEYIVLKPYISENEKGVISIHWRWEVDIFARNYHVGEVLKRYNIILGADCFGTEWTYPFLAIMFAGDRLNGIVFSSVKDELTRERLSLMGFRTIPYGISCDYINPEKFMRLSSNTKVIDVTMVANWNFPIKRQYVLFKALERIVDDLNVVLVGFPSGGYTLEDIRALEAHYRIKRHHIRYYENVSPQSVNDLLNKSKVLIVTSLMEGGNRACFESFFANTPTIILAESLGVPKEYFNSNTGILCKERKLHVAIEYMREHYMDFAPRDWALANISPKVTTDKMNAYLREFSVSNGMSWTVDLVEKQWVGQSFEYVDKDARHAFQRDYDFIKDCFKSGREINARIESSVI